MRFDFASMMSVDITTACNFRCVHCYNDSGLPAPGTMNDAELEHVIRECCRLRPTNFCFCGGEPLLHPRLLELIDIVRESTGGVAMVTNGWLLTPELAGELVRHGVSRVQVSLDGAYSWQHDSFRGVAGSFDRAAQAVRYFKEAGMPGIAVAMIPNRLNYRSVDEVFALCEALGADTIRAMPLIPMGRGASFGKSFMLNDEEMFVFLRRFMHLKKLYFGRLNADWTDPVGTVRLIYRLILKGRAPMMVAFSAQGDIRVDIYIGVSLGRLDGRRTLKDILTDNEKNNTRMQRVLDRIHNLYDMEAANEILF